jgi:type VI protein secretion system component VasF
MTKPNDDPNAQNLDELMEALATVSAKLQGKQGRELESHVKHVQESVRHLVQTVQQSEQDAELRKQAAAQVEQLLDAVAKIGSPAGQAVAGAREPIAQTFRGVDMMKMADGLRVFADWLAHPTTANKAQSEQLIAQLQHVMGPMVAHDAAREDEERRAQIKKDVQKSLDEIFRGKKP